MLNQAQFVSMVPAAPSASFDLSYVHDVLSHSLQVGLDSRYTQHPEFTNGFNDGGECYQSDYAEEIVTLGGLIDFLERCLSLKFHGLEHKLAVAMGWSPASYVYRVGFAYGWLVALCESGLAPALGGFSLSEYLSGVTL